jgi:hypothetical protein
MRLVPLDRELLLRAIDVERDAVTRVNTNLMLFELSPNSNYACLEGQQLIGAGGVHTFEDRSAEAWMLLSRAASKRQIVRATRLARQWLDANVRRFSCGITAYARRDALHEKFFAALGFVAGKRMQQHAGETYHLFFREANTPSHASLGSG